MEKLFTSYPGNRSTTSKYDPCHKGGIGKVDQDCSDCKVFVISDRFLGNSFMDEVMGDKFKFPYVIIADTIGCNLRCWFCYSHHYWDKDTAKKKKCKTQYLSPLQLADQFKCKIEKLSNTSNLENRPITRLRISGGEPVYATEQEMRPYESDKKIDYKLGIDFWLEFFENINKKINDLVNENKVALELTSEWNNKSMWPTFVSDAKDKVNIRFDTNGIAFGNSPESERLYGGEDVANHFIDGVYNLYKNGYLSNIKIWITYSLKGITPTEYYWSQSRCLPADKSNEDTILPLYRHPQISGLDNLKNRIEQYCEVDEGFKDAVDITVEKGIENDTEHNVYLYHRGSLNWDEFGKQSGIKMSEVSNLINLIYSFNKKSKWSVLNKTPYLAMRYLGKNAEIKVKSTDVDLTYNNINQKDDLTKSIDEHHKDDDFHVILKPYK